jgi:hypothetical protein
MSTARSPVSKFAGLFSAVSSLVASWLVTTTWPSALSLYSLGDVYARHIGAACMLCRSAA